MKTRLIALAFLVVSLALVGLVEKARADQPPIEETQDNVRCLDSDEAMRDCFSFIKGFLQGALLTDAAIIESMQEDGPSTFKQRALKTRTGTRNRSATRLAGFCLPEDRSLQSLAEETLDHVKGAPRFSMELAEAVYSSLQKDYPCS